MNKRIEAKRLKGFPDFFAQDVKLREYVISIFKEVFEKYGYEPLETPALELTEMMVGVSGEEAEKQFYRFQDPGGRDVMLKYEVMTSMCRAVAENIGTMQFPYKRYQIQKVWRAENTQKGRYREFTQCDADTIGSSSMFSDAEFIQMGLEITKRLGFVDFVTRISNRKFLNAVAQYYKIPDNLFYKFCMSLDKLKKTGKEKVIEEMVERGIEKEVAQNILNILNEPLEKKLSYEETISYFENTIATIPLGKEALTELSEIGNYLSLAGVDEKLYIFDTSLARGLASYTGPVWEFEILDGGVGSIAGCGRYDNVIGRYIGREMPATGGSFGIERVCEILKDRNMKSIPETSINVMICNFSTQYLENYLELAQTLRNKNFSVMIYPDTAPLKKQIQYADTKKIPYVVVMGEEEIKSKTLKLKDMLNREEKSIKESEILQNFQM